jgi:hypothetical protein
MRKNPDGKKPERTYPEGYAERIQFFREAARQKGGYYYYPQMVIHFAQNAATGAIDPTKPEDYRPYYKIVPYGPDRWTDWKPEDYQDLLKYAGIRPKDHWWFGSLRWNPSSTHQNPAPPRQLDLQQKVKVKLNQKWRKGSESGEVFMLTYMEDLVFSNDGSIPMNIEKGIVDLEDRGIIAVFPLYVTAHSGPGKASFTPMYLPKPRDPNKDLQDFQYLAQIDIFNWPSAQGERELLHELDHVAQWIGTGLIRVAEGETTQDAFEQEIGAGLYGLPKKKYRTWQYVPAEPPKGQRAWMRQELSYDEEFYPYAHDIAEEIKRTGQDFDDYFEDLSDMMDRRPGSRERWQNLKNQVRRLLR